MNFNLEDPLTSFNEEQQIDTMDALFASESEHIMPSSSSLLKSGICFRQQAISLILQGQYSGNFNPIVSYLAATYIDRFIATQEIPQDKPWILRLLVIASVSLASKMNQSDLSFSDIQRHDEGLFVFDAQTIMRMELLILNALNWRMRSITPLSFIHYFLSLTNCRDPELIQQTLKPCVVDIIFQAHQEIAFLEFNPSIIASSALLYASCILYPVQYPSFRLAISSCKYVNTEKMSSCYRLMEEKLLIYRSNKSTTTKLEREIESSSPSPSVSISISSSTTKTTRSVLEIIDNHEIDRFKLKNRENNSGSETVTVTTAPTEKEETRDVKRQRRLDDFFCTC